MSLHTLANHVQSAGRGDDKVLVHMTPGEVGGLQSLAMAHGGSLTINPETGLPEASFLRRLLPTLIGFGLAPITGGLSAALITGAGYTAATGSLKKGLMAGLGAYGGAGLAGGLSSMGAAAGAKAGAAGAAGANSAQTAITGLADDAANFAGTGSNPFSVNPTFNPAASKSVMFNTPGAATPGMAPVTPTFDITKSMSAAKMPTGVTAAPVVPPPPSVVPPASTIAPSGQAFNVPSRMGGYAQSAVPVTPEMGVATPSVVPTPSPSAYSQYMSQVGEGAKKVYAGGVDGAKALYDAMPTGSVAAGVAGPAMSYAEEKREKMEEEMRRRAQQSPGMIRPYEFSYNPTGAASQPYTGSAEQTYFQPTFTAQTPYEAPGPEYRKAAEGGVMSLAVGGPVETMSAMNAIGSNMMYPQSGLQTAMYSNPMVQRPEAVNVVSPGEGPAVGAYTGEAKFARGGVTPTEQQGAGEFRLFGKLLPREKLSGYEYAYDPKTSQFSQTGGPGSGAVTGGIATPVMQPASPAQPLVPNIDIPTYQTPEQQLGLGGFYDYMNQQMSGYAAGGGISHLGDYSDGGRLLKGPGDGVSDSIPASIGNRQPARLADGEFVVPARIVSEIGNGSTEAGARKLYAMMDRVQKARRKTVGKNQVARNTKAEKLLPA